VTPEEQARFDALERRVAELERRLGPVHEMPPVAPPQPPPPLRVPPRVVPAPPPPSLLFETPAPPDVPGVALESRVGVNWISRIAVVTVGLALAFFFEYAFENHWITESTRVLIGLAFAAVALVLGERFWRAGQAAYGQSLAAAGIAFLYLSFWAAFALYHLVPEPAAFVLMLLTTAAAGVLALRYASQAVAVLGLAGGFATPLLLHGAGAAWFVLGYALLLDAGAVWVAHARRWRWPEALACAGTVVLYLSSGPPRPLFAFFIAAYFALFAAATEILVFQAVELLAGTALVLIWLPGASGAAGALLLAIAGMVVADRRGWPSAVAGSFAGFWLAYDVWFSSGTFHSAATGFALLLPAFLLYLGWALRRAPLGILDLILLALGAWFFFQAGYDLLSLSYASFEGLFAVATATFEGVFASRLWRRDPRGSVLAAGVAWVLLVLAVPLQFTGYRITMAWALEAAAICWIGARLHERRAYPAALAVFALVVCRLMALDSLMYSNPAEYLAIFNQRFLTFFIAAASMGAAAWWIRSGRAAQICYVAGHAVLLWGLLLEAVGWAARTAAPRNFHSVASTAVSVVAAAYAVLLVSGGTAWKHSGSRLLGMGLIGLVVLKLYLYDVWLLAAFYRMAAFAILGVLLLVVSYVYSRRARA